MRPLFIVPRIARRAVVLAAALVLVAPTSAVAAVGAYGIAPGTGTFAVLTTRNLATDSTNDQMFYLSTSATGLLRPPFPIRVYDATFRRLAISSNGNVQFGIASPGGNPTSSFECLPTTTDFGAATAFVLWGIGLRYNTTAGEGIFLRTQGQAPNRTFTISWQGEFQVSAEAPANAQVTFRENSRTITYTYGELTLQNLVTIGIQSRFRDSYTERYCDGDGRYPTNGTRLTLGYVTG